MWLFHLEDAGKGEIMKKLLLSLVILAVPFAFALTDAKDDLISLDKEWGVANLKADKGKLNQIYADDMISVGPPAMRPRNRCSTSSPLMTRTT